MNRIALVTGASSDIGASIASALDERGYDLILTGRNEARLAKTADMLQGECRTIKAELSTEEGWRDLVSEIRDPIDVLVNNAALLERERLDRLTIDQVCHLIDVNIRSVTLLMHHFIPLMCGQHYGRILNIASVAAFQPVPGMSLYAASKAYLLSLSESLNEELRQTGVSITTACPGVTRTGSTEALAQALPEVMVSTPRQVADEAIEALFQQVPVCIPGHLNRAGVCAGRLQPRALTRRLGGVLARITGQT